MDVAMAAASRPHDFKLLVQGEGRVGTTMEDVVQSERDPADLIPGL